MTRRSAKAQHTCLSCRLDAASRASLLPAHLSKSRFGENLTNKQAISDADVTLAFVYPTFSVPVSYLLPS
jgi:hypothetical protein